MAEDVLLVRKGSHLVPDNPISLESIEAMKEGEVVLATIRRPRNGKHHNLLFALIRLVLNNQTKYTNEKSLLVAIKINTGYFDTLTMYVRNVPVEVVLPQSISFVSMDQKEFNDFFQRAMDFIVTDIIPGLNKADLEREILAAL